MPSLGAVRNLVEAFDAPLRLRKESLDVYGLRKTLGCDWFKIDRKDVVFLRLNRCGRGFSFHTQQALVAQ